MYAFVNSGTPPMSNDTKLVLKEYLETKITVVLLRW